VSLSINQSICCSVNQFLFDDFRQILLSSIEWRSWRHCVISMSRVCCTRYANAMAATSFTAMQENHFSSSTQCTNCPSTPIR